MNPHQHKIQKITLRNNHYKSNIILSIRKIFIYPWQLSNPFLVFLRLTILFRIYLYPPIHEWHLNMWSKLSRIAHSSKFVPYKRIYVTYQHIPENFTANAWNAQYLEELEKQYRENPSSLDPSWRQYFSQLQTIPSPQPVDLKVQSSQEIQQILQQTFLEKVKTEATQFVRSYQVEGHLLAQLDPLKLTTPPRFPRELQIENYPLLYKAYQDNLELDLGTDLFDGFLSKSRGPVRIRDLVARLKETYCGTIGFEYMHIMDRQKCNWLRNKIETEYKKTFTKEEKKSIFKKIADSVLYEKFLGRKYPSSKRFSLEGL